MDTQQEIVIVRNKNEVADTQQQHKEHVPMKMRMRISSEGRTEESLEELPTQRREKKASV